MIKGMDKKIFRILLSNNVFTGRTVKSELKFTHGNNSKLCILVHIMFREGVNLSSDSNDVV